MNIVERIKDNPNYNNLEFLQKALEASDKIISAKNVTINRLIGIINSHELEMMSIKKNEEVKILEIYTEIDDGVNF